jgi:serine/threonine-protein kinase
MTADIARLTTALADRYVIERELGHGGMATVYLAQDLKHQRKVAVKVLHPELSAILGGERFLNEIRVTANLQHPHILGLYDSGEAAGLLYYVMPFIDGESLRDKLEREKQFSVDQAVDLTRAVASALDYAHRHGVVHRDIKPENILLHDGQPLVADFGISLAVSNAGGSRLTETGLSLGTPNYMSPEQATGDRTVDGRSDIYSLGCMAYEMLTGDPPHTGSTAQAIIAKIITEQPTVMTAARPTTPAHVVAAIHTALAKLPADRFPTAALFAEALSRPGFTSAVTVATPHAARRTNWRLTAGIAALALALGAGAAWLAKPGSAPGNLARFSVPIEPVAQLSSGFARQIALSVDGTMVAFVGHGARGNQVFVRVLADTIPRPVAGTEGALGVFLSPEGRQIGFVTPQRLYRVPIEGGTATLLADSAGAFATWLDNGSLVYTDRSGKRLMLLSPGGDAREIASADSALFLHPSPLPGSRAVLATLALARSRTTIVAVSLADGTMHDIGLEEGVLTARYAPGGWLVYQRRAAGSELLATRFNLRALRAAGEGRAVAPAARITFRVVPQWDVSAGTMVLVPPAPNQLVLTDRDGRITMLEDEPRTYHHPRFSPDGRRIALDITDQDRDVWIVDIGDHRMTRLTVGETANDAFWSPDGRRLAYTSMRGGTRGVFLRNADGSGSADSILTDAQDRSSGAWSPDGRTLVSSTSGVNGLWMVPLDSGRHAEPIAGSRSSEAFPALSRDGRWLAYVSDESGRQEVYVRPFPGPGGRVQVSVRGGNEPVFTGDGRELIYREDAGVTSQLMAATIRTTAAFEVLARTALFEASNFAGAEDHANYDVAPDGRRFVFVRSVQANQIRLIQNWATQLVPR